MYLSVYQVSTFLAVCLSIYLCTQTHTHLNWVWDAGAEWSRFQNPSKDPCLLVNSDFGYWSPSSYGLIFRGHLREKRGFQVVMIHRVFRPPGSYVEPVSVLWALKLLEDHLCRSTSCFRKLDGRLLNICLMCLCVWMCVWGGLLMSELYIQTSVVHPLFLPASDLEVISEFYWLIFL